MCEKRLKPDCNVCDVNFWNRSQFCHNNNFCQGQSEKVKFCLMSKTGTSLILLTNFLYKTVVFCDVILWNRSQLSRNQR